MQPLTDEERKILVLDLRNADLTDSVMCDDAANEIERLVARLEAAHGYADMCEEKIKLLNDQMDEMLATTRANSGRFNAATN